METTVLRIYAGKPVLRLVDGETEKYCPGCYEWWPQTEEFFSFIRTRGHYHNECKACRQAKQAARREAQSAIVLQ